MLLTNNMDNDKTEESAEFKGSWNECLQYKNAFELAFSEDSLGRNKIGAIHTLIKLLKTKNCITLKNHSITFVTFLWQLIFLTVLNNNLFFFSVSSLRIVHICEQLLIILFKYCTYWFFSQPDLSIVREVLNPSLLWSSNFLFAMKPLFHLYFESILLSMYAFHIILSS